MLTPTSPRSGALEAVDWERYDFLDLGASSGGSLRACAKRFGAGRGLGVDIDAEKVRRSREAGLDVVQADARHLGVSGVVRFVSAMDFFEHLPGLDVVEEVLASAVEAATDFLFISHPSFEGEHYLRSLGLMQYWHHWSGHKAHIRISDYCEIFERLGLHQYSLRYSQRISRSAHPSILPVGVPKNQFEYDPDVHGYRPDVTLEEPVWRSQRIYVALRPFTPDKWRRVIGM